MAKLTKDMAAELSAICWMVDAIGRPSFSWRPNYRGVIQALHRRGLVTWKPGEAEGFDRAFAAIDITPAGRLALSEHKEGEP